MATHAPAAPGVTAGAPRPASGQPPAATSGPTLAQAVRGLGVLYGPPLLLDLFAAASTAAVATGRVARLPRTGAARLLRPLVALGAAAPWLYLFWLRPWHLRWGATDEEASKALPGDELVPHPGVQSTRAITIEAPAQAIWPWLVQIGQGRGGFYSYDVLENVAGADIHNAGRIHPEWQRLAVGETVRLAPSVGLPVAALEPNRALVLKGWGAFVLEPVDARRTRLIARSRVPQGWGAALYALTIELPHFIMERAMLRGIKARAERAWADQTGAAPSPETGRAAARRTGGREIAPPRLLDQVRRFNKRILNPIMLRLARRRWAYYAVVRHVGRRSGRAYATPVVAEPAADGFIIPLPYGEGADWHRNVEAAGRFVVERHGVPYEVGDLEVIDQGTALPVLPPLKQAAYRLFGITQFLRVRRLPAAAPPAMPARSVGRVA